MRLIFADVDDVSTYTYLQQRALSSVRLTNILPLTTKPPLVMWVHIQIEALSIFMFDVMKTLVCLIVLNVKGC